MKRSLQRVISEPLESASFVYRVSPERTFNHCMSPPIRKTRFNLLALLIGGALWLGFCWPMLTGFSLPGFRDSAYLYYPLFEWLDQEWQSGQVPLWNPYCNFGMSNIGDNTTSLLYPLKAIFFLRFLDFPTRYGIYISIHILLAGWGAYVLARTLRATPPGAALGAVSFAAGGAVLTQCSNVIYLVSAAWLPFALASVWMLIRTGELPWAILAGTCCALMILGGDPQMVYHVGLIAGASILIRSVRNRRRNSGSTPDEGQPCLNRTRTRKRAVALLAMIAATTVLAFVQLLPTYQWSKLSERTGSKNPLSIYQSISESVQLTRASASAEDENPISDSEPDQRRSNLNFQGLWKSLVESPSTNPSAASVYEFSLPPWSLLELFFPNASGKFFPDHRRWTDRVASPQGSPDRIWFPGIYFGWLTAWLAWQGIKLSGRSRRTWLSRIGLFFLLGSFGWYGLIWLLPVPGCGSQVGGIYWWMATFLPGYSSFRYPAKLFVLSTLCFCVLAGLSFHPSRRCVNPFQSWFGWGMICSMSLLLIAVLIGQLDSFLDRVPGDPLFGPFQTAGAKQAILWTVLQSFFVMSVVGLTLGRPTKSKDRAEARCRPTPTSVAWLLVLVTAIDLIVANHWILALVPAGTFGQTIAIQASLSSAEPAPDSKDQIPLTLYRQRDAYLPEEWQRTSSPLRLQEIIQWQRETLYPKHHLHHRIRLLGSFSSIQPRLYEKLLGELETESLSKAPAAIGSFQTERVKLLEQLCDGEITPFDYGQTKRAKLNVWRPGGSQLILLPDPPSLSHRASEPGFPILDFEQTVDADFEITEFDSNAIHLDVTNREPCTILHACLHDGNWRATISNRSTGQTETKRMIEMGAGYQGIQLQPGQYHLQIHYQPHSFWIAAWFSGLGWSLWGLYWGAKLVRR
jgi:hypothetical protein